MKLKLALQITLICKVNKLNFKIILGVVGGFVWYGSLLTHMISGESCIIVAPLMTTYTRK